MELKRIIARDSRSATEKAMSLYGPDVLVIANQSIDGQTELIVAIDIEPEAPAALVREEPRASFQAMEPARLHKPASGNMQAFEEAMALVRNTQAAGAEAGGRSAAAQPPQPGMDMAPAPAERAPASSSAAGSSEVPRRRTRRTRRSAEQPAAALWGDMSIPTVADLGAPAPAHTLRRSAPRRSAAAAVTPRASRATAPAAVPSLDVDWHIPGVAEITIAPRSTARRRRAASAHQAAADAVISSAPPVADSAEKRAPSAPRRRPSLRPQIADTPVVDTLAAPVKQAVAAPTTQATATPVIAASTVSRPRRRPATNRHTPAPLATKVETATLPVALRAEHAPADTHPLAARCAVAPPAAHSDAAPVPVASAAQHGTPAAAAASPTRLAPQARSPVEAARGHELVDLVRAEIAALRQEFVTSLQLQQLQAGALGHPVAEPLMQTLEQAGAPAGLRTLLLDTATAATDLADGVQRVHAALSAGLQAEALALPMTGLHALCGPSGAGKSLMAARWLQQAAQHHASSEPLVLIAYCDQRPGAWSQTQMLAAQLGVSAYRASSPDTLHTLLDELGERTLVLIDTPGTEPMGHAQTLQDRLPGVALHCVLPADASPATVRRFLHEARVPWHSLLVSKLDESEQPWGLVQQLCNHRLPISAMADSPHATAALQRWRPDALLDRALAPARVLAAAPPDATRPQAPPPHAPATLDPVLRPPRAVSSAPLHPAGAAQNRLGAPPRTPPPAIVLNLQGPGRRRDDPSGPAAPRSRPRPQWVAA